MVTAPSKLIHVVESPNQRELIRKLFEKLRVVDEPGNPVKMQNVALWYLPEDIRAVFASIIREKYRTIGPPRKMHFPAVSQKMPPEYPTRPSCNVDWRRKSDNVRIGR
jgi:hypothetical protein